MRTPLIALALAALLAGCAAYKGIGSETWYQGRMQEIEASYGRKEITTAEYLKLKNEADAIREDYLNNDRPSTGFGLHYGVFR